MSVNLWQVILLLLNNCQDGTNSNNSLHHGHDQINAYNDKNVVEYKYIIQKIYYPSNLD